MAEITVTVGDILFLDGQVPGVPYPTGIWVVCELTEARAWIALVGQCMGELAGIANWYEISVEDLDKFEHLGQKAKVRGTRADASWTEGYDIRRTGITLAIDGDLTKPEWATARRSPRFVDMANGSPAWYDTRAAALYDDEALYIAFWVEDPYPRAKLTERDSIIFGESDVEVFLDFGDAYYELELNALNTVYEVLFIWQDAYDGFDPKEFDLRRALSFGGNFDRDEATFWTGTHSRGNRWAFRNWDWAGLETAVQVQGTLNDDSKPSKGWTAEIKLPWSGMKGLGPRPEVGEEWRIFFGRFQKMRMDGKEVNPAWCWTPHGLYDTHMPEMFTPVRLVNEN